MNYQNKYIAPVVLLSLALVLIVLQWLSTGISGETDSVTHYQMARYAFKHPEYFLNHWGKPLFTILSSPLAQFGYTGAVAFNLICGLLSSWFAYLTAKRMDYRHAWVAIIFTLFTPLYLFSMFSSLTEILFSLVLISAIYLFISKRFIWSAVVISLIPFARTEGMMFIFLFVPAFIWVKQYKSIPFLFSGFIVFSIAGWPFYHDFLWFFTKMPYSSSGSELYGSGSFWYYFSRLNEILDYPLLLLSIAGLLFILLNVKKSLNSLHDIKYITLYFLIIPSIFGFILVQSFLWWQGMMGVLSSTRFMACVLPLGSLLALTGFEWVLKKAKASKVMYIFSGVFILSAVVHQPFKHGILPTKTAVNFAVMEELTAWLKNSPYSNHRAIYTDPMFPHYMNIDPFDQQKCFKIYNYQNIDPASLLKQGELLIWDAQFAGYEGRLPFDSLTKNNNLKLLNVFTPNESFTIIGGEKYKLAVFIKESRDTTRILYKQLYFKDFENFVSEEHVKHITTAYSYSGKQSVLMTRENIYSPAIEGKLQDLPGKGKIELKASAQILNPSKAENDNIILVISTEDSEHRIYKYVIAKDSETRYKPGTWFRISLSDVFRQDCPVNGNYKVYVWYTGKNKIYVDDLILEYKQVGYE
jgi:hypothetical protein